MKVFNTLTRSKEEFVPIKPGKVGFYICGPTVYNDIHIGNARTFLSFDVIRRYLEYSGFDVTFVQIITDVDDKIINRANEEGREPSELAVYYTDAFIAVMEALGVEEPSIRPKATEEIASMIELITCLIQGEHAYEVDGDVYFSVRSFPEYGRLSGRNIDDLKAGARVDVDARKRDPLDFALWKAAKPDEPFWDSPWGPGRPGWHIECSAMSERYLGTPFDIHAGGDDLVFPHHENELAQSASCFAGGFANYWLHGGMLTIDKEKMSKSEGNFLLLKDVLEHVRPEALRLLMLQTHYRSPFDYSPERLDEAAAALERIESALRNIAWALSSCASRSNLPLSSCASQSNLPLSSCASRSDVAGPYKPARSHKVLQHLATPNAQDDRKSGDFAQSDVPLTPRERFKAFMDDDFNTAGAVAVVFELVSEANRLLAELAEELSTSGAAAALKEIATTIVELLAAVGVVLEFGAGPVELVAADDVPALLTLAAELAGFEGATVEQALDALLAARTEARQSKDWPRADAVRDGLASCGLAIEDTAQGPRVVKR